MKMSKAKKKVITFLILIVAVMSFNRAAYSQGSRYESFEQCMENFDISDALSDPIFKEKIKLAPSKLRPYIICRAVTLFNKSGCGELGLPHEVDSCEYDFNQQVGFYAPLATSGIVTEDTLRSCFIKGADRKLCIKFAEAFLQGGTEDVSMCNNNIDCIAMLNLDPSKAKSRDTKDVIYFAKAIKVSDAKICSKIKDNDKARNCLAFLQNDSSICNEDEAFKEIRASYCQYCQEIGGE